MANDPHRMMQSLFLPAAAVHQTAWQPPADVCRTRDGWLVKLDLAGVRPEDVRVSVQGSHLTVRGLRRDWTLEEGSCHYQMEISYSEFERTICLPVNLEAMCVTAEERLGMLLVHIRAESEAVRARSLSEE